MTAFCICTPYGIAISPLREFPSRQAAASAARKVKDRHPVVRIIPVSEARARWEGKGAGR